MFKIHDQHVHTEYSPDSSQKIIPYIEKAISLGCKYFIVTDHMDFDFLAKGEDWHADYDKQAIELNTLKEIYKDKIEIMQGVEIGYKKKAIQGFKDLVNSHDFNIVNISIHDHDGINFYYGEEFVKYGLKDTINLYFDLYIEALQTDLDFDVVCHIDYGFKSAHFADPSIHISEYDDRITKILSLIIQRDKVLEVNTKVQEGINDDSNIIYILKKYYEMGGRNLSVSSDAHDLDRYYSNLDKYIQIAKEIGFDHLCYFVKRKRYEYKI